MSNTKTTGQTITDDAGAAQRDLTAYDDREIQEAFVDRQGDTCEATLILESIHCPACVSLIERTLSATPGVTAAVVNYANRRARVSWDARAARLSDVLSAVERNGYAAYPYEPGAQGAALAREKRTLLQRLGVAAIFGMQVMMLSVALYTADWSEEDQAFRQFFRWVCLLLTAPVVWYSARAFFAPAWRDLKNFRLGMDVPVSLAILLAFVGSVATTALAPAGGHVYYDSVVMFVFLLLGGRYLELAARNKAVETAENLARTTPAMATRLSRDAGGDTWEEARVPVSRLAPGDLLLVRAGERVPADGVVVDGHSSVDESLLTGESMPRAAGVGAEVSGGAINVESPLRIKITRASADSLLSRIIATLERAQADKPAIVSAADRVARWFVGGVLLIAGAVATYLFSAGDPEWFQITLSVLVVSCPCALSLATPAVVTAATGGLIARGVLVTRARALETLAHATHVVFDKTGTLTLGAFSVAETRRHGALREDDCMRVARALEAESEHPIARAFRRGQERDGEPFSAGDVNNFPGQGLVGVVNGRRYFIGTPDFIRERARVAVADSELAGTMVALADESRLLAEFRLTDRLRPGAREAVAALRQDGKTVLLMSGDNRHAAEYIGGLLGIENVTAALKPDDKLVRLQALQRRHAITVMVGDGINDAPVLAAADASVALGSATDLARSASDLVLLHDKLEALPDVFATADKALRVIRQNLAWAVAYNMLALPAAIMGHVPPWLAALGMSLSSLAVVGNALRVRKPARRD